MTARQAAALALPGVLIVLVAVPFGLAGDKTQVIAAAVAVGLCVPTAFGTFWLTRWLAARHQLGGVIGMLLGTMARMVIAVGGGMAVYFSTNAVRGAGLGFWFWLLFAYLAALIAETVLLVRLTPARREAPDGKG